jgi:hypothetical protein
MIGFIGPAKAVPLLQSESELTAFAARVSNLDRDFLKDDSFVRSGGGIEAAGNLLAG